MYPKELDFNLILDFYIDHLHNHVMPFWEKCIDWEFGGITNVVDNEGVILSTDKYLWSQGRALWTFSALYNRFDHNQKWLDIAQNIYKFLIKHGQSSNGSWFFKLQRNGSVLDPSPSIYIDAFVSLGMMEYYRASGNNNALSVAQEIYKRILPMLDNHSSLHTNPLPIPVGVQSHAPSMIYSLVFYELGSLTNDDEVLFQAFKLAEKIFKEHINQEQQVLFEFVSPGGGLIDGDIGQTFIPGHAIESMWFLERIYHKFNRKDRIDSILEVIRWHLEKGWDKEYGGIYLARHLNGGNPAWHSPDSKVWWPIVESLYALLHAYEISGQQWCLQWFTKVYNYAFDKYPNWDSGDWYHSLDRYGKVAPPIARLPVKDPFHLSRSLMLSIESLYKLTGRIK